MRGDLEVAGLVDICAAVAGSARQLNRQRLTHLGDELPFFQEKRRSLKIY